MAAMEEEQEVEIMVEEQEEVEIMEEEQEEVEIMEEEQGEVEILEEEQEVEIVLKVVGPAHRIKISLPSIIKACDLRKLVASERGLPLDRLLLVLRGKTLHDKKDDRDDDDDVLVRLENGDSLMVAVIPKPPAKYLHKDNDDEEDDDFKFQIPQSTSQWRRRLIYFLREKLRVPDILLMAIFSISLKAWICFILWFSLAPVAHRWDLGQLYILGTGFLIIFLNLGKRQHGDLSAYAIFNEDLRELPGLLDADHLD